MTKAKHLDYIFKCDKFVDIVLRLKFTLEVVNLTFTKNTIQAHKQC